MGTLFAIAIAILGIAGCNARVQEPEASEGSTAPSVSASEEASPTTAATDPTTTPEIPQDLRDVGVDAAMFEKMERALDRSPYIRDKYGRISTADYGRVVVDDCRRLDYKISRIRRDLEDLVVGDNATVSVIDAYSHYRLLFDVCRLID